MQHRLTTNQVFCCEQTTHELVQVIFPDWQAVELLSLVHTMKVWLTTTISSARQF
jgi:hypothetical protein